MSVSLRVRHCMDVNASFSAMQEHGERCERLGGGGDSQHRPIDLSTARVAASHANDSGDPGSSPAGFTISLSKILSSIFQSQRDSKVFFRVAMSHLVTLYAIHIHMRICSGALPAGLPP